MQITSRVLVTGATGFIGRALVTSLSRIPGYQVTAVVRNGTQAFAPDVRIRKIPGIAADTNWSDMLDGVRAVVHSAARVHVMHDTASSPLLEFRRVNAEGTLRLARQAADAGVRRFVFISSIKVNGEGTRPGRPYTSEDLPAPVDPYGISKMEAEEGLRAVATETGMEVSIIRPVLVYGPGVTGNFVSMLRWLHRGVPLPLGAVSNRRSLVALDNLVDLVATCLRHPAAANQTFLVSDGEDLSTTELLRRAARALGVRPRLVSVPPVMLGLGATVVGRRAIARRLLGSLQVDISKTRTLLGWRPPISIDEALARTARAYLSATADLG